MTLRKCQSRYVVAGGMSVAILAGAGTLVVARPALAADSGPTTQPAACMQEVFNDAGFSGTLNCTANDVKISRATSVSPTTCIADDPPFTLTATFETEVTANERYDTAFFFNTSGGTSARGGEPGDVCSLSALDIPPGEDLDDDSCGDLNSGTYSFTFTLENVECKAAEGTNQLRLPNCTSWHNKAGTVCDINAGEQDFFPDTKSKCVCDDNFTVPVTVLDLMVVKTATPDELVEPGGTATFDVTIENTSNTRVRISTIIDDKFGNVGAGNPSGVSNNNCPSLIGDVLEPGDSASCSFDGIVIAQPPSFTNTVEACVIPVDLPDEGFCREGSFTITITDAPVAPTLTKTAVSTANCQIQMEATYDVVVRNNSGSDLMDLEALVDDKFGNIALPGPLGPQVISTTCAVPQLDIGPDASYPCQFTARIIATDPDCRFTHTDKVTGTVRDDDGVLFSPFGTADVTFSTTP